MGKYRNCYALPSKGMQDITDISVGAEVLSMGYDGYNFVETVVDITSSEIVTNKNTYTHKGQGVCGKTPTSCWIEPLNKEKKTNMRFRKTPQGLYRVPTNMRIYKQKNTGRPRFYTSRINGKFTGKAAVAMKLLKQVKDFAKGLINKLLGREAVVENTKDEVIVPASVAMQWPEVLRDVYYRPIKTPGTLIRDHAKEQNMMWTAHQDLLTNEKVTLEMVYQKLVKVTKLHNINNQKAFA